MVDEPKPPSPGPAPSPAAAPPPLDPSLAGPYSPNQDERMFAMWAHIGPVVASAFTGNGWIVALIIWLLKKESKFISFHALQELFFELALFVVAILCIIGGFFTCGITWILLFPLGIGALVYAIIMGVKANKGEWAEYLVVGKKVKDSILAQAAPPPPVSPGASPPVS